MGLAKPDEIEGGETIPCGLVIAATVDAFVGGFLIGGVAIVAGPTQLGRAS
jgi:hypothetical protein